MFVQRYSLNYRFGFQLGKKSIFRVEADILQGTEYFNYYEGYSETRSNQGIDTVINWGLYAHTSGFLLGSRLKMRLSTPTDKRFHLFTCLGIEALSVSNSHSDASTYTSRYIKGQSQFGVMREDQQLSTKLVPNYYSINLLQQVGLAFRLSKKEEFFPMNKTYIELNVSILSNFTTVNSIREFNRSFGANLSLIYEFR
jgi:hypothetical protein